MLKILKAIVYMAAFIINLFTYPAAVKGRRVLFISYFSNELEGNFKSICDRMKRQGSFDIVLLLQKYEGTMKSKLRYFFNILKQAYYFNTAKVVVLDANSVVMNAVIKKKKTVVLQIWHACGALKKFGIDTQKRLYRIKPCDVAITSCQKMRQIYGNALRIPAEKVFALGSPRADALFDPDSVQAQKIMLFEQYAIPNNKRLVLYAPTFRGGGIDDVVMPNVDIRRLGKDLGEGFIVGVRLHPLIRRFQCPENVIDLTHEDLIQVLAATDILITDYSTVMFEFALLERPMVFHTPDLDTYKKDRGFYMDYESFVPGNITKTHDELIQAIQNIKPDMIKIQQVKNEYFDFHDGLSTKRVVDFIDLLSTLPDVQDLCVDAAADTPDSR